MSVRLHIRWPGAKRIPDDIRTGGELARREAERELKRVQAETPYYARLGDDLRRLRERNHFADNIRATMRGS